MRDVAVSIFVEGLRIMDALPLRSIFARLAPTQADMNRLYSLDPLNPQELYVPFRWQFALKFVLYALMVSAVIPAAYPLAAAFFILSWYIDKNNFLRSFRPPPPTTTEISSTAMFIVYPLAISVHVFFTVIAFTHFHADVEGSCVN